MSIKKVLVITDLGEDVWILQSMLMLKGFSTSFHDIWICWVFPLGFSIHRVFLLLLDCMVQSCGWAPSLWYLIQRKTDCRENRKSKTNDDPFSASTCPPYCWFYDSPEGHMPLNSSTDCLSIWLLASRWHPAPFAPWPTHKVSEFVVKMMILIRPCSNPIFCPLQCWRCLCIFYWIDRLF